MTDWTLLVPSAAIGGTPAASKAGSAISPPPPAMASTNPASMPAPARASKTSGSRVIRPRYRFQKDQDVAFGIMDQSHGNRVAVILPCYNEAPAIASVVAGFRAALPQATIYVFDNASTDGTADVARGAGATVMHVAQRGKGNVVRRMFADVEADVYVMAEGDGTYDASAAPAMVARLLADGLDMVVGCR